MYFKGKYYGWPIKLKNLLQLPKDIAFRATIDLAINGFKEYPEDNFQTYILRQYGPTLYKHFFEGYSLKFLGIHPKSTHSDWAKVGINRAIINDNAQMQTLFQLLKSTITQNNAPPQRFIYPTGGMQDAWDKVADEILGWTYRNRGKRHDASQRKTVQSVEIGDETIEISDVVWTAPINLAAKQLELPSSDLDYLGLLLFNVMVEDETASRDYQWCYYGETNLLINRVSTPRFLSPDTCPSNGVGYCCEVTCMVGDDRWKSGENLTDWIIDDLVKVGMVKDRSKVVDVQIERIPHSYPIYSENYPTELARMREAIGQFDNFTILVQQHGPLQWKILVQQYGPLYGKCVSVIETFTEKRDLHFDESVPCRR